ncbi:diguanylate cyclase [Microvirga sp. HBU67558]|nr:diguanylate cyclase [Microvirga sp. HBU67558]MBQ0819702.1 diguanylate cyclase [Microvirga sp. HBU67558]
MKAAFLLMLRALRRVHPALGRMLRSTNDASGNGHTIPVPEVKASREDRQEPFVLTLEESEKLSQHAVKLSRQVPWMSDAEGKILHVGPGWDDVIGIPLEEVLRGDWMRLVHPEDRPRLNETRRMSLSTGQPYECEYRVKTPDGVHRWFRARAGAQRDETGTIVRWYGTFEDIHEHKVAKEQLRQAAYQDDLTGLPNRRFFQERLRQVLQQADERGQTIGLLIMDLDDFKQINDRFGHDAGDELLKAFGECLVHLVGTSDTVTRLDGDEFAVILHGTATEDDVARVARAIQARLREPLRLGTRVQEARASIGGVISGLQGTSSDELLKQADLALFSCKAAGRGLYEMFKPAMRDEAQKRASALEVARQAMAREWIVPFYQPKVDLRSGKLTGFEALLRWRHPRLGIQPPSTIAPAFDDNELGIAVGDRMLSCVIHDMRSWLDAGLDIGKISINASSAEFRRDDYAERVLDSLRKADIPTSRLGIEVTETVFLDRDIKNVEKTLRVLSEGGISVALDDFGTGYASLSHLKQFPVNVIKIDARLCVTWRRTKEMRPLSKQS